MPEMQQPRQVLVLGANGKLGRMLRRLWRAAPPPGLATHWQVRTNPDPDEISWQPGQPAPTDLPGIDAVVALWGVTPGPERNLAENGRLARAAAWLGAELGADRVLHCSSAAVYRPGPGSLDETRAGGDVNAYGRAKLDMERIAAEAGASPGAPRSCAMRIANVVGADSLFAALARGGDKVTLDRFDNGEGPWRSYVGVPTLARAIQALATCPLPGLPEVVNVAEPAPYAMEALARAAGAGIDWRPAPAGAAARVELDTGRLQALIGATQCTPDDLIAQWRHLKDSK